MSGRRDSAVRAPEGTLVLLSLDALLRYRAMGLVHPDSILFCELLDRLADGE
jgi:hypothetical protein